MASAGRIAAGVREQAVKLLNEAKMQPDAPSKADLLKNVMEIVLHREPSLLPEFVPYLMELQSEPGSPVRKYLAEMIEEIGTRHVAHISTTVPVLLALLRDSTPAVARRAITSGSNIFRTTLEQVASQGIYTGQVEKQLVDAWNWVTHFKNAVYPAAFQHGNDGVRLLAVKFVETTVLLFTPDPSGSSQPPPNQQNSDGVAKGFNIAWIAGGHPLLDANALGQEASKNLGLLLNQLRAPESSVLPGPVAIVLVNSLAGIAKRRPSMFGRILPVLLSLAPDCEPIKGGQVASVIHALKTAFLSLLKCSQPAALPWQDRLIKALQSMNAGDLADQALRQIDRAQRAERDRASKDPRLVKDERLPQVSTPPLPALALVEERPLQKRPIAEENGNQLVETEESIRKRMRLTPTTDNVQLEMASVSSNVAGSSLANGGVVSDNNLAPLLAYFGALIAQGERGAASVEILISSLTPDMLAELVIVNMQHLPSTAPPLPPGVGPGVSGGLASLLSSSTPQSVPLPPKSVAAAETVVPSFPPQPQPAEVTRDPRRDPRRMDPWRVAATEAPTALLTPKLEAVEVAGVSNATTETVTQVTVKIEGAAGSLSMNNRDPRSALQQYSISQPAVLPAVQVKQEPVEESGPLVSTPPLSPPDSSMEPGFSGPGIPMKSEPATSFSTAAPSLSSGPQHGASGIAPQGIPVAAPIQPIPFVPLTEEQQTSLSKAALVRILEGHKTIAAAGGGDLRVALLARLVTQSCDDVEALEALQKHILADYQSHKGHEVALHVLYQLYAEQASNSSEIAASTTVAYDRFLLSVAQGLRDSLPSSDKSLSRLLGDAPLLPLTSLKLVEDLCNPEGGGEVPTGDRITQGLSALWSLILQRPPTRGTCLKMALKCTVHESDDVRAKAIRLVANKLYPLTYVAQTIEEFAVQSLLAVVDLKQTDTGQGDSMDVDSIKATQGANGDQQSGNGLAPMDIAVVKDESQQNVAKSSPALSISDAQRCMSLFFALCTKKHALLQQLFEVYGRASKAVKQAVHRHIPILFRTIGSSSPELLQLIADPPVGSENLLLLVLHSLTEGTEPSAELITTVKKLYETKLQDAGFLIPVLSSLSKDEVLPVFPRLVDLPPDKFQAALARILQGSAHTGPALTPAEVLIALHGIDPHRDSVSLKKVMDACSACLQQRTVFTQQVLAKVLNQLVEQTPLPLLFMRTVIQAVGAFPTLVSFVMEILSRLVNKQIWKLPKLWMGFLKCAHQTVPHSFHVLLQLPTAQLEDALKEYPTLQGLLATHANQPAVRPTVTRSSLVLLGLAQEVPQASDAGSGVGQPIAEPTSGMKGTTTDLQTGEQASKGSQ
ncbi:hypothetical protein CY35_08G133900 [Sphagnum magellanicum]|nr:hypothetical protein CY35_08G133900 [Sphagnum magellanicum]